MRYTGVLPLLWAGCTGENVIDKQENSAPMIVIMSHTDGVEVQDGYVEHFRATVSDDDNEFDELQIAWYVGENLACDWEVASPAGESFCDIVFVEGDTEVIAEVRDSQGSGGRASISVEVLPTEAPTIELLSPVGGENYYSDQLIQFSALVGDAEDEGADLVITWTSSVDGELSLDTSVRASGEISDYSYLSEGNHAIKLRVEDSSGKFSVEEVVIRVGGENNAPTCALLRPSTEDAFIIGDAIIFQGIAEDADIPNTQLAVEFSSNLDGVFQELTPFSDGSFSFGYDTLQTGTHTITMRVLDEVGAECSTGVLISVGNPPTATIDTPLDNAVYSVGETVTFRGVVSDSEDQANDIAVVWTSDLGGVLSSGMANSQGVSQFTKNDLVAGVHSVSFSATDTTGLVADDVVSFRVNTPPVVNSVTLSPSPVYGTGNLSALATATDADGNNVSLSYAWYEDGVVTSFTGTTINASNLDVGEVWTVRVTPNDGYVNGNYMEASITVSNTAPTISSVSISPNTSVYNDSVLTCSAVATDADQTVVPTYSWTVGGTTYTGASLDLSSTNAMPNDLAVCTASVVDSQGLSATSSSSVTVVNRAPVVSSVSIVPSTNVRSNSTVQCSAVVTDLDGETLVPSYTWMVGANSIATGASLTLSNVLVSPNDVLACVVGVGDGYGGMDSGSASVQVQNTNPVISNVVFTPADPSAYDVVTCSAGATDADGDTPSLAFAFHNLTNNATYSPTSTGTGSATLNLASVVVAPDDVIECAITATDADGGQGTSSATVAIANSAPSLSNVQITPNSAVYTGTSLQCSASASDTNDGNLTNQIAYQWMIGGNVVSNTSTYTVSASQSNVGDSVVCTATVTDSDGESDSATSSVVIQNTAPIVTNVSISSGDGANYNTSIYTCSYTADDPDNETLVATYTWSSDGVELDSGSTFDASLSALLPLDSLFCTVDVMDGSGDMDSQMATVILDNRIPSTPTATITWSGNGSSPTDADALTCTGSGSVDADGQSVTYTYAWTSSTGGTASGSSVLASQTQSGDVWTCSVLASDGMAFAVAGVASVTVASACGLTDCDVNLDLGGGQSMDFVLVPSGTFMMGSPSTEVGRTSDETQHQVTLTHDFYVMTTEVTQGMFYQLMGYQAYSGYAASYGSGADYPAYYVSWDMAAAYANAVTQRHNSVYGTSLQACYTCSGTGTSVTCTQAVNPYTCTGYRLLTEAEWEYTARAGDPAAYWTPTGNGNLPSGYTNTTYTLTNGFDLRQYAWYSANAGGVSHPVAQKIANDYGVYDMSGNVWEWVHDYYGTYATSPVTDPVTTSGSFRVFRGGYWDVYPNSVRSALRGHTTPTLRGSYIGFRLGFSP